MGWIVRLPWRPEQDERKIRLPLGELTQKCDELLGRPTLLRFACADVHSDQGAVPGQGFPDQRAGFTYLALIDEHRGLRRRALDAEKRCNAKRLFDLVQRTSRTSR